MKDINDWDSVEASINIWPGNNGPEDKVDQYARERDTENGGQHIYYSHQGGIDLEVLGYTTAHAANHPLFVGAV